MPDHATRRNVVLDRVYQTKSVLTELQRGLVNVNALIMAHVAGLGLNVHLNASLAMNWSSSTEIVVCVMVLASMSAFAKVQDLNLIVNA